METVQIELSRQAISTMLDSARAGAPQEVCGMLFGNGARITHAVGATNVAPDPSRHFEIDPVALIGAHRAMRAGGPALLGYFHSHPNGLARPSATDADSAARDGRVWIIAAPIDNGDWTITCWHDGPNGFEALSYRVMES